MMRFDRILNATDFSPMSKTAFRYAGRLAHRLGLPLDVVHVLPGMGPSRFEDVDLAADDASMDEDRRRVVAAFRDLASAGTPDGVRIRFILGRGSLPGPVILEEASHFENNVIVLGAQGQSVSETHALGSVAAELIQRSTCPVFVVPVGVREEAVDEEFRSVLTFVTYSHLLQPVIQFALQLARLFDAELDVLALTSSKSAGLSDRADSDLTRNLETQLWRIVESQSAESGESIPAGSIHLHAPAAANAESVLGFAREHGSDLIVIEAPGLGPVEAPTERMMERIVNGAPCPVVLVNTCGRAFGLRRSVKTRAARPLGVS